MHKSNQVLLGVIVLLIGVISLAASFFDFNYLGMMMLIGGFACLLLYRTKRKSWSLVVGVYAAYIGLFNLMPQIFNKSVFYTAMLFIVPGIIFLALYFDKNKKGLLLPGCLFIWFGAYFFLKESPLNDIMNIFPLCMGGAFLSAYAAEKGAIGKWAVYLGAVLCAVSIISAINIPLASLRISYPAVIIICGVIIIVAALHKRGN